MSNINTIYYWNSRFETGDWEVKGGRIQTRNFASSQVKRFKISKDFEGTILDFGCGLGDAIPIYKKAYHKAGLIGIDISDEAIKKCNERFGHLARFMSGTHLDVPNVDIIIASNVFEHLENFIEIAKELIAKCSLLYVIVPYNERIGNNPYHEHINSFNELSFRQLPELKGYVIYFSKGWGPNGIELVVNLYLKNFGRFILGRKRVKRPKQIMFIFEKEN